MANAQLILDRYRPLASAGSGGFATVQVAWDTRIRRKVAIKCIELDEESLSFAASEGRARAGAGVRVGMRPEHATPRHFDAESPFPSAVYDDEYPDQNNDGSSSWDYDEYPDQGYDEYPVLEYEGRFGSALPASASPTRLVDPAAEERAFGLQATVSLGGVDAGSPDRDDFRAAMRAFAHIPGLDEARMAAMLTDANIVTVYDFQVQGNTAYLIMEYVDGLALSALLERYGDRLSLDAVTAVFQAVAHALEVAHENHVLHLDIKPDNILIDRKGKVKVTDFGLARLAGAAGYGAAGGGTIGYMPLEQMRGEDLDERCDEWALASVAYEMLTGENPFLADDLRTAQAAIEDAELVLPSLCWEDVDEQLDDVLFYALDPNREERYETVADFAEEMDKFLGNAKRGQRELAALVAGEEAEEEEAETPPAAREHVPQVPLSERVTPFHLTVLGRVAGALGSGAVAALGLANLPGVSGVDNPLFWGLLAVAVAAGAVLPHVGVLVSFVMLSAALVAQGAPLLGCLLAAAVAAWWWLVGRQGVAEANAAFAVPVAGAVGAGAFAPLVAGFCLGPLQALATTALSVFVGIALASLGSGSLQGWEAIVFADFAGKDIQGACLGVLQQPATWCLAVGWIFAAATLSLFRLRRTKAFALVGVVVAVALLIAATCLAAWFTSRGATAAPSAAPFAAILGSGVLLAVVAAVFPPSEYDEEEE